MILFQLSAVYINELCNRNGRLCALYSIALWIKKGEKDWLSGVFSLKHWSTRTRFETEAKRNSVNTSNICWLALLLVQRDAWAARQAFCAKLRCTCIRLLLSASVHAQQLFFNSQNKAFSQLDWIDHVMDGGSCPHQPLFHVRFQWNSEKYEYDQLFTSWTYTG